MKTLDGYFFGENVSATDLSSLAVRTIGAPHERLESDFITKHASIRAYAGAF